MESLPLASGFSSEPTPLQGIPRATHSSSILISSGASFPSGGIDVSSLALITVINLLFGIFPGVVTAPLSLPRKTNRWLSSLRPASEISEEWHS